MKKYSVLKIIMYLILITNITLIAISGTYAKYTSSSQVNFGYAHIAKWKVLINETDISTGVDVIELNLFDCIYDSDGSSYETDVQNISLVDEFTGETLTESMIAPGTSGNGTITIENDSNVNVKYEIEFNEHNDENVPVEYSIDNVNYYKADDLADVINNNSEKINYGASKIIQLYWRWQYEGDGTNSYNQTDETDTVIGVSTEDIKYQITAKIIVTQVD